MFTRPIRGWIKFAQIFGTIISVGGLIVWIWLLSAGSDYLAADGEFTSEERATYALVLGLFVYFAIKQLINCIFIVSAIDKMDDFQLSANRWMIAALSLSVNGFFTPFIMSMFPNTNIKSTIKPKVFLSKVIGLTLAIGAGAMIVIYGAFLGSVDNVFETADSTWIVSTVVFCVYGFLFVLGVATCALFFNKDASKAYDTKNAKSVWMKIFANMIVLAITGELILLLIWNWIKFIGQVMSAIQNMRGRDGHINPLGVIIGLVNISISIIYIGFLTKITNQTIAGIWKDQADYTVFQPLQKQQTQNNGTLQIENN